MPQVLELIIFAGLAGVVLYQLYAVLGRRVGRQPEDAKPVEAARTPAAPTDRPIEMIDDGVALTGLAALKAKDPAFDVSHFLNGSRGAYQMVVEAFAAHDRATLRNLLAPRVMASFDAAIAEREAQGLTETVEFLHPPRADLEKAEVSAGDLAKITVRFLAEMRARSKGPDGEAVDDRRTAELWTFERNLKSKDPNWLLINVDAAEA